MAIVEEQASRMMISKKKSGLTMEDYLDFIDDRTLNLNGSQLRQIIRMHGFSKPKTQKSVMIDAVSTMELMDLSRSTLINDGVSGDASCFTLQQVINDLKHLNWQECHVTSLVNLSGVVSPPSEKLLKVSKSKRLKRKKVEVEEVDPSGTSSGTTVPAGSTTLPNKRKRKPKPKTG